MTRDNRRDVKKWNDRLRYVIAQSSTQADEQKYKDYLHWLHESSFVRFTYFLTQGKPQSSIVSAALAFLLVTIFNCKCSFSIFTSWITEMHDHHLFQDANVNYHHLIEKVENRIGSCSGCSNNCPAMQQLLVCYFISMAYLA